MKTIRAIKRSKRSDTVDSQQRVQHCFADLLLIFINLRFVFTINEREQLADAVLPTAINNPTGHFTNCTFIGRRKVRTADFINTPVLSLQFDVQFVLSRFIVVVLFSYSRNNKLDEDSLAFLRPGARLTLNIII